MAEITKVYVLNLNKNIFKISKINNANTPPHTNGANLKIFSSLDLKAIIYAIPKINTTPITTYINNPLPSL